MQNVVSLEFHKHHSSKTNQISSQSNQDQPKIIMHNPKAQAYIFMTQVSLISQKLNQTRNLFKTDYRWQNPIYQSSTYLLLCYQKPILYNQTGLTKRKSHQYPK